MSMGMQTASMMVQLVHDLTRDAIAQVVGSVISYAATLAVSLGTATPYVVAQATSRVSALATRVGTTVTKLLRSGDELMRLIDQLGTLFRKLDDLASNVLPGGGRGGGARPHTGGPEHAPSGPRAADDARYASARDGDLELGPTPGFRSDGSVDPGAYRTAQDEAFFWSGRTDGVGGADTAGEFARDMGGTTLEQLMERRGVAMPEWDADNPATVATWKEASAAYADGVSGTVHVVLGDSLRDGNVWETAEFPALVSNPDVDRIVRIDPATGLETQIWP
jgi:hypothetical protein